MEHNAYNRVETPAFAAPPPVEFSGRRVERHLDQVPDWVLPNAFREIGIAINPTEVAAAHGIDSQKVATLCNRGYVRVATPALHRAASEAARQMWDTLEAVDSRATRHFPDLDRETYFRDKTAWQAVFYEHVRRHV